MRKLAASTVVALATVFVVAIAYVRRSDVLLLALSLALTAAVHPLIDRLVRRGVPRALSVAVVYLGGVLVLGTLIGLLAGPALSELRSGIDEFFARYESARQHLPLGGDIERLLARALPPASELYRGVGTSDPAGWALSALGVTANAVQAVTQTLVVIVLSVYWAAAERPGRRVGTRLLTALGFSSARAAWARMLGDVGAQVRVEIARVVSYVALLGFGYWLLELRYWVVPALAAALLGLIPFLGALLAMLIAAAAGATRGPLVSALAVACTALIVVLVEAATRRALRAQQTHPILLALTVLALASSAGLISALLAPPLAAAIASVAATLIDHNGGSDAAMVDQIDARLAHLRRQAEHAPPESAAMARSLVERTARVAARVRKLAS